MYTFKKSIIVPAQLVIVAEGGYSCRLTAGPAESVPLELQSTAKINNNYLCGK